MELYEFTEATMPSPSNEHFSLHTHSSYEIYLFLEGNSKYVVEGKNYSLSPYDIIVIRKHDMHRVYHNDCVKYRRITINIEPEFFDAFNCQEYEKQFIDYSFEIDNKISAKVVKSSGIYDAIMRLKNYTDNFKNTDTPIAVSTLIEILYLINQLKTFSKADKSNKQFKEIISYVNANYTDDISLDKICEMFFFSKYHLCHVFKKETGLTFRQYINKKRFALVNDLVSEGINIGEAAATSGFGSYPVFYRAYVKEFGISPKEGMNNANSHKSGTQ